MSRPRFLADEDLRFEIVLAIRRLEPAVEIATVSELGRSGSSDGDILEFAHGHDLLVVSHDVNTMKAEAESRIADGRAVTGVFLVAQR
ncbi:MAG: DUF5615 family PIN-like protein [Planctomycetes bacterium]|nr:DUF5615 family PIN-like protein [Planctomycetota bacterium]